MMCGTNVEGLGLYCHCIFVRGEKDTFGSRTRPVCGLNVQILLRRVCNSEQTPNKARCKLAGIEMLRRNYAALPHRRSFLRCEGAMRPQSSAPLMAQ